LLKAVLLDGLKTDQNDKKKPTEITEINNIALLLQVLNFKHERK